MASTTTTREGIVFRFLITLIVILVAFSLTNQALAQLVPSVTHYVVLGATEDPDEIEENTYPTIQAAILAFNDVIWYESWGKGFVGIVDIEYSEDEYMEAIVIQRPPQSMLQAIKLKGNSATINASGIIKETASGPKRVPTIQIIDIYSDDPVPLKVELEDLTITGGQNELNGYGGGVSVQRSTLIMRNCHVISNTVTKTNTSPAGVELGGGIGILPQSSVILESCWIIGNDVQGYGGGIGIAEKATLRMADCIIEGNSATQYAIIYAGSGSSMQLVDCQMYDNTSSSNPGIFARGSNAVQLIRCELTGNKAAHRGRALKVWNGNLTMTHCLVADNEGGGLELLSSQATISNCTITNNHAGGSFQTSGYGGGIYLKQGGGSDKASNMILSNSIVIGNKPHKWDQIYIGESSSIHVTYSDVVGINPPCRISDEEGVIGVVDLGLGIIEKDPLFEFPPQNYMLSSDSPCIDSGDPSSYDKDGSRLDMGWIANGEGNLTSVQYDVVIARKFMVMTDDVTRAVLGPTEGEYGGQLVFPNHHPTAGGDDHRFMALVGKPQETSLEMDRGIYTHIKLYANNNESKMWLSRSTKSLELTQSEITFGNTKKFGTTLSKGRLLLWNTPSGYTDPDYPPPRC